MLTILTPAASHHLTTVDRVKQELGIAGSSSDAKILTLISEASSLITSYCNRDTFGRQTVRQTERLREGRECIVLALDIDVSISSVTVDGAALSTSEYELDGSLLYRLNDDRRCWWAAGAKVVIEYDAGFILLTDLPEAIERAAIDSVVSLYHGGGRDGAVRSEDVEGISVVSYFDQRSGLPIAEDRVRALDRWRLVSL